MTRARDIANLVDANGDIVAGALDNVPAADVVNDTTPQLGGNLDTNGNDVNFGDDDKAQFGDANELQIFHTSGGSSVISQTTTGNLFINATTTTFRSSDGGETYASLADNGAVTLRYDNSQKLATTSTGVDVTGVITTDGMTTSADVNFGDNDKAIFGAGSDLQIYHDGSNSYIDESNAGDFLIRGANVYLRQIANNENYIRAIADAQVDIYYNGSIKLTTTSTGIDVTGNATFDDNGKAIFGGGSDLEIYHDGSNSYIQENGTGNLRIRANDLSLEKASGGEYYLQATSDGAVRLYYDANQKLATTSTGVTVTGTVTATSFSGDGSNLTGVAAGATGGGSDEIFYENGQTVTTNYTITNGKNAMSAGPISINTGVTVTVGAGETWTVV